MRIEKPTGKQILFPGLILVVAAMGLLFFLQIRWMNNSLQAQNMRYRRGVNDNLNHVAWRLMERLELDSFDADNLEASLVAWKSGSDYPDLVLALVRPDEVQVPGERTVYFQGGDPENPYMLILDGTVLYEKLLLEDLRDYSPDYSFTLSFTEADPDEGRNDDPGRERENDPYIYAYLPGFIDISVDKRRLENLLFNRPDFPFSPDRGPEGDSLFQAGPDRRGYRLEVDLNEGRGTVQFEQRLRRSNLGLLVSLALILIGAYYLLFRLYRDEESHRRTEQTFVASVSHELRTPIAVIKTASENLQRGIVSDGERVKSYGKVIQSEADRLNRMVEAVLYYSRMEGSGLMKIQPEDTDPRSLTGEIVEMLKLTYPDAGLESDVAGAPGNVSLDRESFRLILENLVANAILHGRGGPVRVRLESDYPSRWRLVVEDEGPGISRREQKRIFDPFVRGRRSEEDQIRGSGLGLYLVKRAVRALGGTVILESPYESPVGRDIRGCRFTLILPVKKEEVR